jgi:hypothetical protein
MQRSAASFDRSERAKFPFALDRLFWGSIFRTGVEIIGGASPFQADDEGSIPFTRSTT